MTILLIALLAVGGKADRVEKEAPPSLVLSSVSRSSSVVEGRKKGARVRLRKSIDKDGGDEGEGDGEGEER